MTNDDTKKKNELGHISATTDALAARIRPKAGHTPGPWKAWNTGHGMGIVPEDALKGALIPNIAAFASEICRVKANPDLSGDAWDAHWETQKANARLISTAPELLRLLKETISYLDHGDYDENATQYALTQEVHALIAKIEGLENE